MRRMTIVVAMVARCLVDYVHILTKDSAATCAQMYICIYISAHIYMRIYMFAVYRFAHIKFNNVD